MSTILSVTLRVRRPAVAVLLCILATSLPLAAQLQRDPLEAVVAQRLGPPVEGDGVHVRVVDDAGEPVAGAAVSYLAQSTLTDPAAARRRKRIAKRILADQEWMVLTIAAELGRRYVTGEDGAVTVPRSGGCTLVAVAGRSAGVGRADRGDDAIEIRLRPRRELIVRVEDGEGRPLRGVPVMASPFATMGIQAMGPQGWTNAEGVAHVPVTRMLQSMAHADRPIHVGAAFFGGDARPVEVGLDTESPAPVEIVVTQPFGRLKVFFENDSSALVRRELSSARIDVAGGSMAAGLFEAPSVEPDSAMFPCVALGQDFVVTLRFEDGSTMDARGAGPTRPGELKVLTASDAEGAFLRGALVGLTGKPAKNAKLSAAFVADGRCETIDIATDANGEFTTVVPEWVSDEFRLYLQRRGFFGALGSARCIVPRRPVGAPFDLGAVELKKPPLLCAGRVVDAEGAPLAQVEVQSRDVFGAQYGDWSHDPDRTISARTNADGRFELRHVADVMPHLSFEKRGYFAAQVPQPALGERDVVFVMHRAGAIVGSVANPPEIHTVVAVRRLAQGAEASTGREMVLESDGSFRFDDLPPGRYSVAIAKGPAIDGVLVEPGAVVADPRLQKIDWRATLVPVSVKVLDADGRPAPAETFLRASQPDDRGYWQQIGATTWRGILAKDGATIEVCAPGCVPRTLDAPVGDQVVRLQRQLKVPLRFGATLELPDGVLVLVTVADELDGAGDRRTPLVLRRSADTDPRRIRDGTAVLAVDAPGPVTLGIEVRDPGSRGVLARIALPGPPIDVGVEASKAGLDVTIPGSVLEQIEAAADRFAARRR